MKPLHRLMGVEPGGVDLSRAPDGAGALLRPWLDEYQLVCLRDQNLSADDLVRITAALGPPIPPLVERFTLPHHRAVYVISNIVENGMPLGSAADGLVWHTDLAYLRRPAGYTLLLAKEVPSSGAQTLFASTQAGFDALDTTRCDALMGLYAYYDYAALRRILHPDLPLSAEQQARAPRTAHPLIRRHPTTGRCSLYVNRDDCVGIDKMDTGDARALIDRLVEISLAQGIYSHEWRAGDLVIWDNRGLLHTATPFDKARQRRLMYRTMAEGEVPIPAGSKTLEAS